MRDAASEAFRALLIEYGRSTRVIDAANNRLQQAEDALSRCRYVVALTRERLRRLRIDAPYANSWQERAAGISIRERELASAVDQASRAIHDAFLRAYPLDCVMDECVETICKLAVLPDHTPDTLIFYFEKLPTAARERLSKKVREALSYEYHSDDPILVSEDYRIVVYRGTTYSFTKMQADCIRVLYESRGKALADETVCEVVGSSQNRLAGIFRIKEKGKAIRHPAMGTLIVKGKRRGTHMFVQA